jgi:hypothetical protein
LQIVDGGRAAEVIVIKNNGKEFFSIPESLEW